MKHLKSVQKPHLAPVKYLCIILLCCCCCLLASCDINLNGSSLSNTSCQSNCDLGTGANGLKVIVEPDAGPDPIVSAIKDAKKSVSLEIYLLSNQDIISALEDDANQGIDVRVMLEQHPFGGGNISPTTTVSKLKAAGVKAQFTNPAFALTHEKGMVIDGTTAYIMTSNFTNSALGAGSSTKNREYLIVDTNKEDVKAVAAIFQADWDRTTPDINADNLVVSPVNSRDAFSALIGSAKKTLQIEAEEMNDDTLEEALITAQQQGVEVQVILPRQDSDSGSTPKGIASIKHGGVSVREDSKLYMHAKIIIVDGKKAFVGSENISTQSLDKNRELGILISDNDVLNTLQQTFEKDWSVSKAA